MTFHRLLAMTVLSVGVLAGTARAQAGGDPQTQEYVRGLHERVARAEQLRRDHQPGYDDLLRESAADFRRVGDTSEALRVLALVIANPESDFDLAEAHRMSGQYNLASDRAASISHFNQQLAVFDAHPEMKRRFHDLYASGACQLAVAYSGAGSLDEAMAANDRLLGADRALFSSRVVQDALVNRSRIAKRRNDLTGAVAAIDDLLTSYPQYGRQDGSRIGLQLERADLAFPDKASPEYTAALLEIWNDPQSRNGPSSLDVAITLVDSLRRAGRAPEAVTVAEAAIQNLDSHRAAWTADPAGVAVGGRSAKELHEGEVTLLSGLTGADTCGRADAAMRALNRLLPMARTQDERHSLQMQIDRVTDVLVHPPHP